MCRRNIPIYLERVETEYLLTQWEYIYNYDVKSLVKGSNNLCRRLWLDRWSHRIFRLNARQFWAFFQELDRIRIRFVVMRHEGESQMGIWGFFAFSKSFQAFCRSDIAESVTSYSSSTSASEFDAFWDAFPLTAVVNSGCFS